MTKKVPRWVEQALGEFEGTSPREDEAWEKLDFDTYSTVVSIIYPPVAKVYFVVDALLPDHPESVNGWREIAGEHLIQEFAENAARKRAYNEQIPYRVRKVVWDG